MEESYNYILNNINLRYGDTVVAGISGGPDSMALLHLLIRVKKVLDITIVCAHVNHNLREESKKELIFVKNYCKKNDVIFESYEIDDYDNDNIEAQAREKRYNFFNDVIKKYEAKYLFTAHHGDDLMETILMRIVRGSTLKGYSGFQKVVNRNAYKIIRPLITVTKAEILEYMKTNKLKYAIDQTNFTDEHTRNRYRKYVLPVLKKEEPKVNEKFLKFSNTLYEYNEYVEKQVKLIAKDIYSQNVLNIPLFLEQDKLIQIKFINYMLDKCYGDDIVCITDLHSTLVYNLIKSKRAQVAIYLPNNVKAQKSYDIFTLNKEVKKINKYEYKLEEYLNLPNGKNLQVVSNSDWTSNYICRLSSKEVKLPLIVRTKIDGDKMSIKGMIGSKKIKDIFINSKIPNDERDLWPIVLDSDGNIVWLPGLKKSKYDKQKEEFYDIIVKYY